MHVPCTWLECKESIQMETAVSCKYLAGKAFSRDTHETFCSTSLYCMIHTFCILIIYTHITHKCDRELLRENPSKNTWELEIVILTILYTFFCGIFSSPAFPFSYQWEINSPNTYHTFWECPVRFWCCWETLEKAKDGRCNMELIAGWELDKTRF